MRPFAIAQICVVATVFAAAPAAAQAPDTILVNGKILTVDAQFPVAEAVAVRDGRILAVGTNDQVKRLIGPSTRAIDLQGKTVVPGFIDSDGDNAFAGGDLYKDTMVNGKVGVWMLMPTRLSSRATKMRW